MDNKRRAVDTEYRISRLSNSKGPKSNNTHSNRKLKAELKDEYNDGGTGVGLNERDEVLVGEYGLFSYREIDEYSSTAGGDDEKVVEGHLSYRKGKLISVKLKWNSSKIHIIYMFTRGTLYPCEERKCEGKVRIVIFSVMGDGRTRMGPLW